MLAPKIKKNYKLEAELDKKLREWQPELVQQVSSVKGIGKRATAMLIVMTQGFKYTQNHGQLISYAGLNPREYSSGKSIRGKVHVSKKGGKRYGIFCICVPECEGNQQGLQGAFDRLVERGKNKKLAIIAVCNKLLKQVFGVVKSGVLYQDDFCKKWLNYLLFCTVRVVCSPFLPS